MIVFIYKNTVKKKFNVLNFFFRILKYKFYYLKLNIISAIIKHTNSYKPN